MLEIGASKVALFLCGEHDRRNVGLLLEADEISIGGQKHQIRTQAALGSIDHFLLEALRGKCAKPDVKLRIDALEFFDLVLQQRLHPGLFYRIRLR